MYRIASIIALAGALAVPAGAQAARPAINLDRVERIATDRAGTESSDLNAAARAFNAELPTLDEVNAAQADGFDLSADPIPLVIDAQVLDAERESRIRAVVDVVYLLEDGTEFDETLTMTTTSRGRYRVSVDSDFRPFGGGR